MSLWIISPLCGSKNSLLFLYSSDIFNFILLLNTHTHTLPSSSSTAAVVVLPSWMALYKLCELPLRTILPHPLLYFLLYFHRDDARRRRGHNIQKCTTNTPTQFTFKFPFHTRLHCRSWSSSNRPTGINCQFAGLYSCCSLSGQLLLYQSIIDSSAKCGLLVT